MDPSAPVQVSPESGLAVDKDPGRIRRMFASIAPRYDFINRVISFRRDVAWRKLAAREAGLAPGARILDLCAGTADLALAFHRRDPTARIVAADFTHPMLALARVKIDRRGARIPLACGDATRLPFRDGVFDAVTVAFGIRNTNPMAAALAEIRRVLRPGGKAVILEFSYPTNRLFRPIYNFYFGKVLPRIGNLLSRSPDRAYSYLNASVREFGGLDSALAAAGFSEGKARRLSLGIAGIWTAIKPARPA